MKLLHNDNFITWKMSEFFFFQIRTMIENDRERIFCWNILNAMQFFSRKRFMMPYLNQIRQTWKVHDLHTNASFQRFGTNIRMKILWDLFFFQTNFLNLISNIFEQYEEKNLHPAFPRTSSGNESHPLLLYEPLISAEDTHPWEQRVFENERRMVGLSWEIEGKMYILVSLILLQ